MNKHFKPLAMGMAAAVALISGKVQAQGKQLAITVVITNPKGDSQQARIHNGLDHCLTAVAGILDGAERRNENPFFLQTRCLVLEKRNEAALINIIGDSDEADLRQLRRDFPRNTETIESLGGTLNNASLSEKIIVMGHLNLQAISNRGGRVLEDSGAELSDENKISIIDDRALFAIGQANFDHSETGRNGYYHIRNIYLRPIRTDELQKIASNAVNRLNQ